MGAPPPPARVPAARGHPRDRSVTPGCGSASPKTTPWGSGGRAARPPPSWDRTQFAENIHFFPQTVPSGTDHRAGTGAARPAGATKPTPAVTLSPSACSTHLTNTFPSPPLGAPSPLSPRPPKITNFPILACTRRPCHPLQHQPSSASATNVPPNPGGPRGAHPAPVT